MKRDVCTHLKKISQVELSLLTKKKPELEKERVEKFKREMEQLTKEAIENYEAVLKLMSDIRAEYAQRGNSD